MGLHLTTQEQVRFQASPCGICGGQNDTRKAFSLSISGFPCRYHSTIAPYSFINLPPTLYNVFLPVLQYSPVSIIPPFLHTHSFIYHLTLYNFFLPALQFSPASIIPPLLHTHSSIYHLFFSQYFSFPLSVAFHHCFMLIHPSTTHAI